jgi:hypothetical protein
VPDARYQGEYAEQYVRTLALACDVNVASWAVDDFGVDLTLCVAGRGHPKVDMQVKSWSTPRGTDDFWRYDRLNEVQYNHLVGGAEEPPRYLVVLIVPAEAVQRTEVVAEGLLLRHQAYFAEVQGPRIEPADASRHKQVLVPRRNVLTPATLRGLLQPQLVPQRSGS